MKKYFVPIFVFTLIIILPAISWYYLKSGMSWRREAMSELSDLGSVESVRIQMSDSKEISLKELQNHLMIFFRVDCTRRGEEYEVLEAIRTQFQKREDVLIFVISDCTEEMEFGSSRNRILKTIDCESNLLACEKIDKVFFQDGSNGNVAFVDGNLHIRNYYDSSDEKENKRLIEHMAMMLPDERSKYGKENRNKR